MKLQLFIFALFFSSASHAWRLNNNFMASFKDNQVKVFVDSGTVCANNQMTPDEIQALIGPAIDRYWNKVPTANLKLISAGFSDPIATINSGRLCSPSDSACITAGEASPEGLIPAVREIIIACNDNPDNFGGGNVLAVTVPNNFSGKDIVGAVIIINEGSTVFGGLSQSDKIGVIAHEIGHALGLGHSKESSALMFYRIVEQRSRLGQDDIDGISFLYPMGGDLYGLSENGLLGGCGTITTDKNPPGNPPFLQMGIALGVMIGIFELIRLFNRSKRRSTT